MNSTLVIYAKAMLQVMAESLIDTCLQYLPYVELAIGFPCLLCNLYFAFRFAQITTINPNLRVLLITTNMISACIALLHPFLEFMPERMYSVANGKIFGASVFYTIAFLNYAFVFLLDCKFIMILIERRFAFKHRANYEQSSGILGFKIFILFCLIAIVVIVSRIIALFCNRSADETLDETLQIAFIAERSPAFFVNIHAAPVISSILGVYELHRLVELTKRYRYLGTTLSERFEISQTAHVVGVLKPLLYVYCTLTFLSLISYSFLLYIHYGLKFNTKSSLYLAITNMDYLCASSYTMFSTAYMIFAFRDVKRIFFQDLSRILCVTMQTDRVRPREIDKSQQTNEHFDYLNSVWQSRTI